MLYKTNDSGIEWGDGLDKIKAVNLSTIDVEGLTLLEQSMKVVLAILTGKFDVNKVGNVSNVTFYGRDKTTEIVEGTIEDGIRIDSTIREDNL